MAGKRRLALHAALPDRYGHFDIPAATIDHRGRLVALLVEPTQLPATRTPSPVYDAVVVICDNGDIDQIPLNGLDRQFHEIDVLDDGIILGAARIERIEPTDPTLPRNIVAFDTEGHQRGAFYAGDAIAQMLTDPDGRIWISSFDETTFAFAGPDGSWSNGSGIGLARWDNLNSEPWFAFHGTVPDVDWFDCYAVNVGRTRTHACPYTKFPLVEMDADGVRSITRNSITRCVGLTVSDSTFGFFDQHRHKGKPRWAIRKGRLQDGVITETDTEELVLPDGRRSERWARGNIGRDSTLWLHENGNPGRWYRYELDG
ncbi:hypothetical protein [Nocardia bovistercoris]|uniref:Uncharacterized protein n=1 Tax=Nocardia bovistercoris TaxID=2785916 RepID=A0A931I788_9NOCA|nr:hypothetical protein [Nocardia bovistercoris]MBH0774708.1 hypothetical protein [Nocardia bovistercoris]